MKKKNKLMTICVTTANRAKELKKCLISLKKNDLAEVDIIIGDNSQDDKSKGVVKKIFPKAKYFINKPRTDEVKNTNKCFSFSKTPYILLLHDDDMLSDNFIAEVINAVKKYPDADIIYTARIMIDQNSVILKKHITNIPSEYIHYKAEKILDHYMLGNIITTYQVPLMTPGMIFKTQLYNKTGGLNSKIDTHYDTEFIYKILALSKKLLLINKPIYLSTVWNGFSGRTKSSERGVVYFAQKGVIDSFIEFCKKNNLKKYPFLSNKIYEKFSNDCAQFNGPFTWINLRYQGSFGEKNRILKNTFNELIKLNCKLKFNPKLYLVYVLNLVTPKIILKNIQTLVVKMYFLFS